MPETEGAGKRKSRSLLETDVPNYKVIRKIGSGGMGEVYLAEDLRLRRRVAIKQLSEQDDDVNGRKLKLEARAAARLNHPGIAMVYDLIEVNHRWHIVMEFVEGETLADRIQRERLSVNTAVQIVLQIAEALVHAHEHGIIHRDLKPANIRVTPEGVVKLLDFGLAKTEFNPKGDGGTTTLEAHPNQLVGTLAYMSPEQLMQKPIDTRTDVYSLGVVMFEILSGRRPFNADKFLELAAAILTEAPPLLRDFRPDVPDDLNGIVVRAMSKSRDDRHASMAELRDDLRAVQMSSSPGGTERLLKQTRSNPILAIFPFLNLTGDPASDFIGAGLCEVLISNAAGLNGITVLPRASVSPHRSIDRDITKIGKDLGATYVVDGSYQRVGERIRLTATLIDTQTDRVIWRDQLDGTTGSMFELQTTLGQKLAEALPVDRTAKSSTPAAFPTQNVQAFTNYAQARVLLERKDVQGNVTRAVDLLDQALTQDPRFALAHAALGEAYWERYHHSKDSQWTFKALSAIAEALRLQPNQCDVRRTLARIYRGTGRNEEALEELRLALTLDPNSDETHRNLGSVLFDLGRRDEALQHFEQAIRLRPNFWENHREIGKAWYRMGQYDRAIVAFSRVAELQPDSAWGFLMLGTTYHAIGDVETALLNYERSIAISPTSTAATNMGTIWYGKKNYAEALKYYDLAIQLEPNRPLNYRNRGDAYLRLEDREKARESYERAARLAEDLIRVNPKDAEELSRLAVYEAKLARFESARRHASEASALDPLRVEIIYRSAIVHALEGNMAKAAAQVKLAVDRGYSFSIVRDDDDLQELRKSEAFVTLFGPVSES